MNMLWGKRQREPYAMISFAGKYIYNSSDNDAESDKICSEHIDLSIRSFFTKMIVLTSSYSLAMIGPVHAYITEGVIVTTTEAQIPFFGENSTGKLISNILLQCTLGFHGIIVFFGFETIMSLFSDAVTIAPKLVEYKLSQLDNETSKPAPSTARINFMVKEIAKQSLDADE